MAADLERVLAVLLPVLHDANTLLGELVFAWVKRIVHARPNQPPIRWKLKTHRPAENGRVQLRELIDVRCHCGSVLVQLRRQPRHEPFGFEFDEYGTANVGGRRGRPEGEEITDDFARGWEQSEFIGDKFELGRGIIRTTQGVKVPGMLIGVADQEGLELLFWRWPSLWNVAAIFAKLFIEVCVQEVRMIASAPTLRSIGQQPDQGNACVRWAKMHAAGLGEGERLELVTTLAGSGDDAIQTRLLLCFHDDQPPVSGAQPNALSGLHLIY